MSYSQRSEGNQTLYEGEEDKDTYILLWAQRTKDLFIWLTRSREPGSMLEPGSQNMLHPRQSPPRKEGYSQQRALQQEETRDPWGASGSPFVPLSVTPAQGSVVLHNVIQTTGSSTLKPHLDWGF